MFQQSCCEIFHVRAVVGDYELAKASNRSEESDA